MRMPPTTAGRLFPNRSGRSITRFFPIGNLRVPERLPACRTRGCRRKCGSRRRPEAEPDLCRHPRCGHRSGRVPRHPCRLPAVAGSPERSGAWPTGRCAAPSRSAMRAGCSTTRTAPTRADTRATRTPVENRRITTARPGPGRFPRFFARPGPWSTEGPAEPPPLNWLASASGLLDRGCAGQVPEILDGDFPPPTARLRCPRPGAPASCCGSG